ncbi:hypothetical protein [Streptomyces microflavus]|uniref:hypothetical protein n=1 Tax=Streptomyces microflavus TaxID=1919 RepID=UPI00382CB247
MSAEARLKAIRSGDMSGLTAGEQARVVFHTGRGCVKVVRGKSTSKADRAVERIFKDAEERVAAEHAAEEALRKKKITDKAMAKAKKRAESKWW